MAAEFLEKLKGKKIVFCLPGSYFSGRFLINFTTLKGLLDANEVQCYISYSQGSCLHRLRNECGGGNIFNGLYQTPFSDKVDYDYLMWIDSDIVFSIESFERLVMMDREIATGWYMQENGSPAHGFINKSYLKYTGKEPVPLYDKNHIYELFADTGVTEKTEVYPIDWIGMGWMLIQKGVMESIKYPWFGPRFVRATETLIDTLSEDLSFALAAKEAGYDIWLDPLLKVGHEKIRII